MNKKALAFIVVILCILLFGGGFFAYQFVKDDDQSTSSTPSNGLVEKDYKESGKQGPAPSDKDAQRMAKKTYTAFFEKLYDTAKENDWYGSETVDYKVLEEELSPYVTQRFFEYIQALPQEDLFCQCDSFVFELPEFDARNIVVESTSNYMKMRTVHFENYVSEGSQIFLEFKKDSDGKWKVDKYNEIFSEYKPLNLTAEEAKAGYEDHFKKIEYIKETYIDEGDELAKVYLFHVMGDAQDYITSVHSSSGFETHDIPLEIVPSKWRDKVSESNYEME